MTAAAAPGQDAPRREPWVPVLLVAALGAAAVLLLATSPPTAPGARRVASPEVLLATFDAAASLVAARPGRRGLAETASLLACALPFHVAVAAAAGAAPSFHAASLLATGVWAAAAVVASRAAPRVAAAALGAAAFAVPLAAYALAEFARLPTLALLEASPLTGPVLLARGATTASAANALPSVGGAAAVVAVAWALRARGQDAR